MKKMNHDSCSTTRLSAQTPISGNKKCGHQLLQRALGMFAVGFCLIGLTWSPIGFADELTLEQFDHAVDALHVGEPGERDPLAMAAALVSVDPGVGDTVIAVLKLRMLPGWYIYSQVPDTQPFIASEWILDTGPGLEILDDWAGPPSTKHKALSNTRIHAAGRKDLVFFREMEISDAAGSEVNADIGLRYQICNREYCLPPKTKKKRLAVSVSK